MSARTRSRILVIEDDPAQQALICEVLRMHYRDPRGEFIVAASTAGEALAKDLRSFNMVLQNYNLPDMNGLDLLTEIIGRADIPVMMVTSENTSKVAIEALRRGAQDYVVKLGDYLFALPLMIDKNIRQHELRKENQRLQARLTGMLDELQDKNRQLMAMAQTDHLTGLANRRRFGELLERSFAEAHRYDFDLTCCMLDLDHYKQFNDTLGHQVGDELLQLTSELIRSSLRASDSAARYGGDEFVILLPHTSIDRATAVCQRIRAKLARASRKYVLSSWQSEHAGPQVTLSVGIASLQADHPVSGDELVALADKALYIAKENGKNRIVTLSPVEDEQSIA